MTAVMAGQLDLFDLLELLEAPEDQEPVNDPFYQCTCGSQLPCHAPRPELAVWAEAHREHAEAFAAAQWPAGVCAHCGDMYWDNGTHPYWTFERMREEHREVESGVCFIMAEVRDTHEAFSTGRKVPEPHWSKADLRNYIAELADHRGRAWKLYDEGRT